MNFFLGALTSDYVEQGTAGVFYKFVDGTATSTSFTRDEASAYCALDGDSTLPTGNTEDIYHSLVAFR